MPCAQGLVETSLGVHLAARRFQGRLSDVSTTNFEGLCFCGERTMHYSESEVNHA